MRHGIQCTQYTAQIPVTYSTNRQAAYIYIQIQCYTYRTTQGAERALADVRQHHVYQHLHEGRADAQELQEKERQG